MQNRVDTQYKLYKNSHLITYEANKNLVEMQQVNDINYSN